MKLLPITAILFTYTSQLKWDQLQVPSTSRGTINQQEKYWTGSLYQCDAQCHNSGGKVCGTNQRQCCSSTSSSCQNKFGMQVCKKLMEQFQCKSQDGGYLLKQALPSNAFPDLAFLYH